MKVKSTPIHIDRETIYRKGKSLIRHTENQLLYETGFFLMEIAVEYGSKLAVRELLTLCEDHVYQGIYSKRSLLEILVDEDGDDDEERYHLVKKLAACVPKDEILKRIDELMEQQTDMDDLLVTKYMVLANTAEPRHFSEPETLRRAYRARWLYECLSYLRDSVTDEKLLGIPFGDFNDDDYDLVYYLYKRCDSDGQKVFMGNLKQYNSVLWEKIKEAESHDEAYKIMRKKQLSDRLKHDLDYVKANLNVNGKMEDE